jgi:hypothetical protein
MTVAAKEGKSLQLRILDRNDQAVRDLFDRLCLNKSDEVKAEFNSGNEEGISCALVFWSISMINKETEEHLDKLIPVPVGNTSRGMHKFLETKTTRKGELLFLNITLKMKLKDGRYFPFVMEEFYKCRTPSQRRKGNLAKLDIS